MFGRFVGATRRNHALEHATIAVLLGKLGPSLRLIGRATRDGFYVYGDVPTDVLQEAATEALGRLKGGEAHLAVSPLCGTNIAVSGILAGVSSVVAMGPQDRREDRLPNVLLASMVAVLAAQPIGRLIQKYLTTSPDLTRFEIRGVRQGDNSLGRFHKVDTGQEQFLASP